MKYWLLFFSLFTLSFCFAQNPVIDSLFKKIKTAQPDTSTAHDLVILCDEFSNMGMYDSAIAYGEKAIEMSKNIESKTIDQKSKYSAKRSHANALNNIGLALANLSEYNKALEKYFESLKIREKMGEKRGIAGSYNNIGNIYLYQKQNKKALGYYQDALKVNQSINNKKWMAINYNNIGFVYADEKQWDKALENFLIALKINEELKDDIGLSVSHINLADYYRHKASADSKINDVLSRQDLKKSSEYYDQALKFYQQYGYQDAICTTYNSLGILSMQMNKTSEALSYLQKGMSIAREIGDNDALMTSYEQITDIYSEQKDFENAFRFNKLAGAIKDSIYNNVNSKQIAEMSAKYESAKKQEQITLLKKDQEISSKDFEKQKVIRNAFIAGSLLLLLFGGYIYSRFKKSQKQKNIIEFQKHMVESKQKEIIDSIEYAKRIQFSLLPTEQYIDNNLKRLKKS